jgi:clan AA aspartic protease
MIIGFVTLDWKAEIRLILIDQTDAELEFPVFIDTGFNGSLSLPHTLLEQIGATPLEDAIVYLADGSTAILPTFAVRIYWENELRLAEAFATHGDAVLGMHLLENHELKIEVRAGGPVTIELIEP